MKVLVILGHPRPDSFAEAMAEAYMDGAGAAGVEVTYLKLYDLEFDIHVTTQKLRKQFSEPDLDYARQCVSEADHLVFVYPTWWATMPALLKGFLDRLLLPGFAFEEKDRNTDWIQLLKGKTAQLITTMDTPILVYRFLYHAPGTNAMRKGTLGYCGIKPVRFLGFSPISYTTKDKRQKWLRRVRREGEKLESGVLTSWEKLWFKMMPWLKAIRFQFYPMTWVSYAVGGFSAAYLGHAFDAWIFWLGYAFLFLLEVAVVFNNDYHDYPSDEVNKNYSPFTGGSRVLVDGDLTRGQLKKGSIAALFLAGFLGLLVVYLANLGIVPVVVIGLLSILALGYTAPPLKLSYRTLGEIDVGLTHSIGVMLCGFLFQGGGVFDPFPWMISVPLFLSIVVAIILAGIPDSTADKRIDKKTVAVRFGRKNAMRISMGLTAVSLLVTSWWWQLPDVGPLYSTAVWIIVPHGLILLYLLSRYAFVWKVPDRIDGLLALALLYIFWFGLFPLLYMASG